MAAASAQVSVSAIVRRSPIARRVTKYGISWWFELFKWLDVKKLLALVIDLIGEVTVKCSWFPRVGIPSFSLGFRASH